jgi:hypothetical protein
MAVAALTQTFPYGVVAKVDIEDPIENKRVVDLIEYVMLRWWPKKEEPTFELDKYLLTVTYFQEGSSQVEGVPDDEDVNLKEIKGIMKDCEKTYRFAARRYSKFSNSGMCCIS